MTTPKTPRNLAPKTRRFWHEITQKYELRADELRVLEDACREADLIDEMAKAARDAPRIVHGSQGQPVINPLISELRQHRVTLGSLLRQLKLPDDAGVDGSQQRQAAMARWRKLGERRGKA